MAEIDSGRRRVTTGLALWATAAFVPSALAAQGVRRASRPLMGTHVAITGQGRDVQQVQAAIDAAFTEMTRLSDMMSRYHSTSVVSALHLASGLRPLPVPAELMAVLDMAQTVAARSDGGFDATVGVFAARGFDATQQTLLNPQDLAAAQALVGYRDLVLDRTQGTAFLRRRGMRLDLGGIAKLPILEAGMRVLQRHGVTDALIDGGGDVRVSGRLHGRPWRVGLRDPRDPARLLGVLPMEGDGWLASSGDYERFFIRDGHRHHHILDPRTGRSTAGVHGVALVARDLSEINGLGAAMMVAGPQAGRDLAQRGGVESMLAASDRPLWLSSGLAGRLESPTA